MASCGVVPVAGREVTVRRRDGVCYYAGVSACGSVWTCAVCAAKIAQLRAEELRAGFATWADSGGYLTMLTLTVSHTRADDLADLLERMSAAMRDMWGGAWAKRWRLRHQVPGLVRNLESTWGYRTGWHPHSHVVVFSRFPLDSCELFVCWDRVTARHGLRAIWAAWKGGFISMATAEGPVLAEALAAYASKMFGDDASWGAAEELTLWHYKTSQERYTPLDLLRNLNVGGHGRDFWFLSEKFREYAAAYHGKRQLYWSRGLCEVLGLVVDASDEELANEEGDGEETVCSIDPVVWPWICGLGLRLELFYVIEEHGAGVLGEFYEYVYNLRLQRQSN